MFTPPIHRIRRRAFLQQGALVLAASSLNAKSLGAQYAADDLRVGLVTDLHYADKPPAGSRHYRETLGKLGEAATKFAAADLHFVVELGDLIDAADSVAVEQRYLKTVYHEFSQLNDSRHHVLGNHCVDTLTKAEFLEGVGQAASYYSFDRSGYHFVVLDACFRSDGVPYGRKNADWRDANIPPAELEWLQADLRAATKPAIIFAHQRLDVSTDHGVKNSAQVRELLEASGKVLAVFQGHSHRNDLSEIGGIHYCTLVAMVEGSGAENNGYSILTLGPDQTIRVDGFRQQAPYRWS